MYFGGREGWRWVRGVWNWIQAVMYALDECDTRAIFQAVPLKSLALGTHSPSRALSTNVEGVLSIGIIITAGVCPAPLVFDTFKVDESSSSSSRFWRWPVSLV